MSCCALDSFPESALRTRSPRLHFNRIVGGMNSHRYIEKVISCQFQDFFSFLLPSLAFPFRWCFIFMQRGDVALFSRVARQTAGSNFLFSAMGSKYCGGSAHRNPPICASLLAHRDARESGGRNDVPSREFSPTHWRGVLAYSYFHYTRRCAASLGSDSNLAEQRLVARSANPHTFAESPGGARHYRDRA